MSDFRIENFGAAKVTVQLNLDNYVNLHFKTEVQAAMIWPKTLDGSSIDKAIRVATLENFFSIVAKWHAHLSSPFDHLGSKEVWDLFERCF